MLGCTIYTRSFTPPQKHEDAKYRRSARTKHIQTAVRFFLHSSIRKFLKVLLCALALSEKRAGSIEIAYSSSITHSSLSTLSTLPTSHNAYSRRPWVSSGQAECLFSLNACAHLLHHLRPNKCTTDCWLGTPISWRIRCCARSTESNKIWCTPFVEWQKSRSMGVIKRLFRGPLSSRPTWI